MSKKLLLTSIIAMHTLPAFAGTIVDTSPPIGCASEATFKQFVRLFVSGDKDAVKNFLVKSAITGECKVFERGETAFLDEMSLFSGTSCVRARGDTQCFWTFAENYKR
jgi:hypothetical protein